MTRITRRQFVREAAFAAWVSCHFPTGSFGQTLAKTQQPALTDRADIKKLASKISGHVILPDSSDYELAREVNNLAYDRHPALIVRCANADDVARTLDFGQSHSLPLAVRAGGHSAAGLGVCDGAVIDLSGMKRVEVDAEKRIARAEGGSLVGEFDDATQRFGLATPVGTCPTVGLAGLTLGGGEGALMPKYGTTCDNVISARVVTVDGRQVEASQETNPDLFWAIRGGGGNFGVVTAFEYRLHAVSEILAGTLVCPAGRVSDLLQAYVSFTRAAPDELSAAGLILPSPEGPRIQVLVGYCGHPSMGNDLLRPLRSQLKPQVDTVKAMPYLEAQRNWFPAAAAKPSGYFVMNAFVPDLGAAAIAAITEAIGNAPPRFRVLIVNFRGTVTRVRSMDMAFSMRQPGYEVDVSASWAAPQEKDSTVGWVKALREELQPFSRGLYVNGLSETNDELMKAAYGNNYARLAQVKKKYDPSNVLRLNPNIKPG